MLERAIACPRCGRTIDSTDDTCTWCGASRPSAWARWADWSRVDPTGDKLVKGIIAANAIFYVISLAFSRHRGYGMDPLRFLSPDDRVLQFLGMTGEVPVFEFDKYWTLISANYLHGGVLHILFNMMALRQIGPWVNAEFGPSRMFIIYTFSGVAGYLVSCFAGIPYTIGASASICGLIGALFYFGKSRGGRYGAAVSREVGGWLISLIIFGLIMPGINNWGHGGGALGGFLFAMLLGYRERRPENVSHWLLAIVCIVATVVIIAWRGFETYSIFHS